MTEENTLTISAAGQSVTISESDLDAVLENLSDAQGLYDGIVKLKKQVTMARKDRADALAKIPRYVSLKKDIKASNDEKKKIAVDFDSENPQYRSAVQYAEDMLFSKSTSLGIMALAAYKAGTPLKLIQQTRKGKAKKVEVRYKIEYKQLALFS